MVVEGSIYFFGRRGVSMHHVRKIYRICLVLGSANVNGIFGLQRCTIFLRF